MDTDGAAEFSGIRKATPYERVIERRIVHVRVGRQVKFRREEAGPGKRIRQESDRDFV